MSDTPTHSYAITTSTIKKIRGLDALPTIPLVALQLGELVHSRSVNVQQVVALMANDPATSAKLLKLVNSAYFAIPGGVTDIARAIPFVGFNTLYQLVLSISVIETLGAGDTMRDLWVHSLAVASLARELSTEVRHSEPEAAFTAGLLHDMGTIALAKLEPEKFAASRAAISAEQLSIADAEARFGLTSHELVGCALARTWRFPATLAVPIERHHDVHLPSVRARLTPSLRQVTEIVAASDHLADSCAATFGLPPTRGATRRADVEEQFERLGFASSQEQAVLDRARRQLERSKVFLALVG